MVLKIYGSAMSTARVLVTLLENQVPFEFILVDIAKEEHLNEEWKKMQPFGKVPVMDDEGFVLFESRAICRYIARKYPSEQPLIPSGEDIQAYARFEQACSMEQSCFAAAAETIGTELYIRPKKGLGPTDTSRLAQAEHDLDTVLGVYDRLLAKQKYLGGNELSLADLFHLPNGAALKQGKWAEVFVKHENVNRWFNELQERTSWREAAALAKTAT